MCVYIIYIYIHLIRVLPKPHSNSGYEVNKGPFLKNSDDYFPRVPGFSQAPISHH